MASYSKRYNYICLSSVSCCDKGMTIFVSFCRLADEQKGLCDSLFFLVLLLWFTYLQQQRPTACASLVTTFSALLDSAKETLRAPVGYHSLVADEVPDGISEHLKMRESLLAIFDGGFHLIGPFNKNSLNLQFQMKFLVTENACKLTGHNWWWISFDWSL